MLDWGELSKDIRGLAGKRPLLILGSREISARRVAQLSQQLIANTGRILIWGCLQEKFILGLENSPQFRALSLEKLLAGIELLDKEQQQKTLILQYPQPLAPKIIAEGSWSGVIGINGSWHRAFHYREEYQAIKKMKLKHKLVSAFCDEAEAKQYERQLLEELGDFPAAVGDKYNEKGFFKLVDEAARRSFDHTWQTGAVLSKNSKFLLAAHNQVVPFETYALLHGASKEKHLTPPQDLNHYNTNHAEVELVLQALKKGVSLEGCSLYINLMPCPICARMLVRTGIKEVVCKEIHSGGYATKLLSEVEKDISRIIKQ